MRVVLVRHEDGDCGRYTRRVELDFAASTRDILSHEIAYTINDGPVVVTRAEPPFDGALRGQDFRSPSFDSGDWFCARMCTVVDACDRTDDGEQCGGCSASGSPTNATAGALLGLAVWVLRRRRSRFRA